MLRPTEPESTAMVITAPSQDTEKQYARSGTRSFWGTSTLVCAPFSSPAPALLGFAEPLQMATAADGVLIVSRAGETKRKAVGSVVSALNRLRANVIGIVLNQVKRDTSDGDSYYGYYRSQYYYANRES